MNVKKNRDPERGEQQSILTDTEPPEFQQCYDPGSEYPWWLASFI